MSPASRTSRPDRGSESADPWRPHRQHPVRRRSPTSRHRSLPYWRPTAFAIAIVVADALVWEGADESLVASLADVDDIGQMLVRALIYRLVAAIEGGFEEDMDAIDRRYRSTVNLAIDSLLGVDDGRRIAPTLPGPATKRESDGASTYCRQWADSPRSNPTRHGWRDMSMRRVLPILFVLRGLLAFAPAVAADTVENPRESFQSSGFDAFSSVCGAQTCTDTFMNAVSRRRRRVRPSRSSAPTSSPTTSGRDAAAVPAAAATCQPRT